MCKNLMESILRVQVSLVNDKALNNDSPAAAASTS